MAMLTVMVKRNTSIRRANMKMCEPVYKKCVNTSIFVYQSESPGINKFHRNPTTQVNTKVVLLTYTPRHLCAVRSSQNCLHFQWIVDSELSCEFLPFSLMCF